jgi:peptide/nickel transport system ATP-binding protein
MGVIAQTAHRVAVMYAGRIVEIGAVHEIVSNPRHPYTRGLMGSIPRIGGGRRRLRQVEGSMPRLNEIPPGCPFSPRCPEASDPCCHRRPELMPAGGTDAACWLHARAPALAEAASNA